VQGTCTKTFKVAKHVESLIEQLNAMEETELAAQETYYEAIVQRELDIRNGKETAHVKEGKALDIEGVAKKANEKKVEKKVEEPKEENKSEEKPAAASGGAGAWTDEEVDNLTKAIVRFPPGTG
jgi:hypothetical protein